MESSQSGPVMLAFLDGDFAPLAGLRVSPLDAGFAAGVAASDFCRVYGGRLFRHADHLRRFRADCAALGFALPYSDGELSAAANRLVSENAALGELAVVSFATPGVPGAGRATVGMYPVALPPERYAHLRPAAVLRTVGALPGRIVPAGVKHRSRLAWHLAERAVRPGEVAVLLDGHGSPDAAIGSVIAVTAGGVARPPAGRVLEGVTMGVVAELCRRLKIPIRGSVDRLP